LALTISIKFVHLLLNMSASKRSICILGHFFPSSKLFIMSGCAEALTRLNYVIGLMIFIFKCCCCILSVDGSRMSVFVWK
jgi:hypothetical protein